MDWVAIAKIALPLCGAFVAGSVAPRVRRAVRNRGKTEQEIASEELDRALKRAESAHANADPSDDAPADEEVAKARAALHKVRRARAIWDGIADDTPTVGDDR